LERATRDELAFYRTVLDREMQRLETLIKEDPSKFGVTEQELAQVFTEYEFKPRLAMRSETRRPYHLYEEDWIALRDSDPLLPAYRQRKAAFWESFASVLNKLPDEAKRIAASADDPKPIVNRFPTIGAGGLPHRTRRKDPGVRARTHCGKQRYFNDPRYRASSVGCWWSTAARRSF
jgi:hypothetical protein